MHQVSKEFILKLIVMEEKQIPKNYQNIWRLIKCEPELWEIPDEGRVWVSGLMGKKALWWNSIEEGWNFSRFSQYGQIDEGGWETDEISHVIWKIINVIEEKLPYRMDWLNELE